MNSSPCPFLVSFSHWSEYQIKGWMKPITVTLAFQTVPMSFTSMNPESFDPFHSLEAFTTAIPEF